MPSRRLAAIIVAAVLVSHPGALSGQVTGRPPHARSDTLLVRVLTPDSLDAPDAEVFVTDVETRQTVQAQLTPSGSFRAVVAQGFGTYVVVGRAPLFQSSRTRLVRQGDAVPVATLVLSAPPVLPKVQVSARKRVAPSAGAPPEPVVATGGRSRNGAPTALQESLLEAASAIPGVELLAGGSRTAFSVLGQGPESNRITLNGLSVPALRLPRDAGAMVEVATGSSDPARGGFSGGELAVRSREAMDVTRKYGRISVDAPFAERADVAATYGRRLQASGTVEGSVGKRWRQTTSAQVGLAPQALPSALQSAGRPGAELTEETRRSLRESAAHAHLPLEGASSIWNPSVAVSTEWTRPDDRHPVDLLLVGSAEQHDGIGAGWTVVPRAVGRRRTGAVAAQVGTSWAWGGAWLHEVRAGLHVNTERQEPLFDRPAALVITQSAPEDAEEMAIAVRVGGGPRLSSTQQYGAQVLDKWTWYSPSSAHRVGAAFDLEHAVTESAAGRDPGTFTFPSLDAFAANTPARFTRTATPGRAARQLALGASVTDQWRLSDALQLQLGGRVDAYALRTAPLAVPLGTGNDEGHWRGADVSPRFGVTGRLFSGARATRIQLLGGRYVSRWSGVGLEMLARPAGEATLLQCVDGVVGPAWEAPEPGDAVCANAAVGPLPLPATMTFADRLRPPEAWRASVAVGRQVGRFAISSTAIYSRNGRLLAPEDANLRRSASFVLAAEGKRPVFAPASAITSTGSLSIASSREDSDRGPVYRLTNRGRSEATEAQLTVGPAKPGGLNYWSATYVWGRARASHEGLFAPSAGDPRMPAWGPSDYDVRHRVVLQGGHQLGTGLIATGILNFRSGLPFTPMVDADINGDGQANDAAFIPAAGNAAVAALGTLGGSAGECARAQEGRIATVNSCRGPWSAMATAQIATTMGASWLPRYTTVALQLVNVPALLDLALHGSAPRGWGRVGTPDTRLLTVTGFDQAASAFRYRVNPGFGRVSPVGGGWPAPFRVTLEVRSELGPDVIGQQVTRLLARGRSRPGTMASPTQLAANLRGTIYDPIPGLLKLRDSIMLSAAQEQRLQQEQERTAARLDSIFAPLGQYLSGLPARYDLEVATNRLRAGQAAAYGVMLDQARRVQAILGADQVRLLGGPTRLFLDPQSVGLLQRAFR